MKEPQKLTLENMYNTLESTGTIRGNLFFNHELAIALDFQNIFNPFLRPKAGPYLMEDYRIGFVKKGQMKVIINLKEYIVSAGCAMLVTPGSIGEPKEMSPDFTLVGMGIPKDTFHIIHHDRLPDIFSGQMMSARKMMTESEMELLNSLFHTLWKIVSSKGTSKTVTYNMVSTITAFYDNLFASHKNSSESLSSSREILNRFIHLVNTNCKSQRKLQFYADKMCITERYLGTVIRQASGITAKEWIDKAVITNIKVMLRHGNLQVSQISDELYFPNPSFFCKYFKRLTGLTPQEYRTAESLI